MPLIPTTTQAEADEAAREQIIYRSAEAANHLAATLKEGYRRFWSLPDDRMLARLNDDPARTAAELTAQRALAAAANAALDAVGLPQFSERVPVTSPPYATVDEVTGIWTIDHDLSAPE